MEQEAGSKEKAAGPMPSREITQKRILVVLASGFALVIVLLLAAGFIGFQNLLSIRQNVADLVRGQMITSHLIDETQRESGTLSAIFHRLARDPDSVNRDEILDQLDETDEHIEKIIATTPGMPDQPLWHDLLNAATQFSTEARRLLAMEDAPTLSSRELVQRHEQVISVVSKLLAASYRRAIADQNEIDRRSEAFVKQSLALLGVSLLLALAGALLTVAFTASLFRRMEWQTAEIGRVSWRMLENQETTARRFSHELHDELGQSLAAVKANLLALGAAPAPDKTRLDDCVSLVDDSIHNVRELSQLLRPTILDDFGLDAGLRWLSEGFQQRTGVEVAYESNFKGRLHDQTETHLFRIAQEALTNVARHSGASRVNIKLKSQDGGVYLSIADNGHGLPDGPNAERKGLGMIGMRARSRSAGGELKLGSLNGSGLLIEVRVPARAKENAEENPNLVG
jgi:signal transduction histidine kinase